jgi:hypothetical protein
MTDPPELPPLKDGKLPAVTLNNIALREACDLSPERRTRTWRKACGATLDRILTRRRIFRQNTN